MKKETKHSFFYGFGISISAFLDLLTLESRWCELWTYVAGIIFEIDDG